MSFFKEIQLYNKNEFQDLEISPFFNLKIYIFKIGFKRIII